MQTDDFSAFFGFDDNPNTNTSLSKKPILQKPTETNLTSTNEVMFNPPKRRNSQAALDLTEHPIPKKKGRKPKLSTMSAKSITNNIKNKTNNSSDHVYESSDDDNIEANNKNFNTS